MHFVIGMAHISWWQAILLGLLQGLTEFLPVSSTAHMAIASRLLFHDDVGAAFSAIVQLGPILAIIIYFWKDLVRYLSGIVRTRSPFNLPAADTEARIGWYVLLGTVPLLIFGKLLEKHIDTLFRKPSVMGIALIALAFVLFLAERVSKRNRNLESLTLGESQVVGWAQALALVPGASRSGVTITTGLFLGLDRESAARFSFLLSIPAITAAGIYKLYKVLKMTHLGSEAGPYLLGAVVAGIFAYIIVRWFMGYMKEHNTAGFIVYRILLGVALLGMVAGGVIKDNVLDDDDEPAQRPAVSARYAPSLEAPPVLVSTSTGRPGQ